MSTDQTNTALILQPVVRIPLSRGQFAIISELDAPKVLPWSWCATLASNGLWYAMGTVKIEGKRTPVSLHRWIAGMPRVHLDHRDGNGLNCRRSNIRAATKSQNAANMKLKPGKFKGVTKATDCNRWVARITVLGKRIHIGCFGTPEQAARAYNQAAVIHFGQFARINPL